MMNMAHSSTLPTLLPGLEAVSEVHRLGSYRAAARALFVTPSAISHRVRDLEAHLGFACFERRGRGVVSTYEGRLLAEATARGLAEIRGALDELLHPAGPVVIACSTSFSVRWLMPRLDDIHRVLPGADLRVTADDEARDLRSRGIDGLIRYGPAPGRDDDARLLSEERVFPICHPSVAASLHVPNDLSQHRLLHDDTLRDHAAKATWRTWLAEAEARGLPCPDVDADSGTRLSHAHLALEAAAAGQGIALARTSLVAGDLAAGRLVAPFAFSVPTALGYAWTRIRDRPVVRSFEAWLFSAMAEAARRAPGDQAARR